MNVLMIQPRSSVMLRGITHPVCRDLMMSATFLQSRGFCVRVWDRCVDPRDLTKPDGDFRADAAIFFISQSSSVKDAIAVGRRLRRRGAAIIWADMVAILGADLADAYDHCDYILTGEYFFAAEALLNAISEGADPRSVEGVAYRENGRIRKTAKLPLPDFSLLPPIDWSLIDVKKCFRRFTGCKHMLYLNASVGCPYDCGFCSTPFCYGARRKRPIGQVIEEIDRLVPLGLDGVNFSDELLLFTETELEALRQCRERHGNAFIWGGETRPQILTRPLLEKMYAAGCRWLLFGLESGSQSMRERLRKPYDEARVRSAADWCAELGIATFGSFIIGFPGETEEDLKATVRFALSLDLDAFLCNYFILIPESALCAEMAQTGEFRFGSILEYNTLVSPDHLMKNFSKIPYRELATVKASFDFLTITRNKKTDGRHSSGAQLLKKAVNTAVESLRGSPKDAAVSAFNMARRGLNVLYYPLAHPGIRKKYGLYIVNRKNRSENE